MTEKRRKSKNAKDQRFCCVTDCEYSEYFPLGCLIFQDLRVGIKCKHLEITIDPKLQKASFHCKNKNIYFYGDKKKYEAD